MTEKRFTLGYEDDFLRWIRDNPNRKNYVVKIGFGEEDNLQDVCDLLNQLNNENEQLKSKLFDCNLELEHSKESVDDAYWELTEIKKENDDLKKGILKDIFADECEVYKKENEQLKSELKAIRKKYNDFSDTVEQQLKQMDMRLVK